MHYSFTVSPEDVGKRIDTLCTEKFPQYTRNQWQKQGTFVCDNTERKPKTKVKVSEDWIVTHTPPTVDPQVIIPWDTPLNILSETEDYLVIDKPVCVSVHPSLSEKTHHTVVNALIFHFGKNLSENFDEIEGIKIPRPGIVHRLDKTTSGALLIAKNNTAHHFFTSHWKEVTKTYYAIVHGTPPKKGRITGAIFRDPANRKKMKISGDDRAKESETLFENVLQKGNLALLKINILTGRTHQIRVHLSHIGFSVLGDTLYGGQEAERIFLHAHQLQFPDPKGSKEMLIATAPTPNSFDLFFK